MTRLEELTREANKLQGDMLAMLNFAGVSPLIKPLVEGIIGRLHYLHVSLIEELKRRE